MPQKTFAVRVTGERALFCPPWLRAEPYSEPVMTPSAADGILRAMYRKPQFQWVIQRIHVCAPIQYDTAARTAVINDYSTSRYRTPRRSGDVVTPDVTPQVQVVLRDIDYVIEAMVATNGTERRSQAEVEAIVASYFTRGHYWGAPHAGRTEFVVRTDFLGCYDGFREYDTVPLDLDLGPVLVGMRPVDPTRDDWQPVFARLHVIDGVVDVPQEVYERKLLPALHASAERQHAAGGAA